jgi:hypothetical protein
MALLGAADDDDKAIGFLQGVLNSVKMTQVERLKATYQKRDLQRTSSQPTTGQP